MNKLLYVLCFFVLFSCAEEPAKKKEDTKNVQTDSLNVDDPDDSDSIEIKSDYSMDNVDPKQRKEFKQSLAQIEKEHGEQWGFCACIIANDSLNKAVQTPNLSDAKLDVLIERMTTVEEKCQAFLVQNPNQTPEERARHEKKVRDCLKASK
jgi:hypothetical protein